MMLLRNVLCLLGTVLCLVLAGSRAYADSAGKFADIERVEAYLGGLKTARAGFVQTAHDGSQASGTFFLSRPGRLRFDYDPPIEDFVVADGTFIYFYDSELGEQSNAPVGQTLADFILREDLSLTKDVRVTDVARDGGLLRLTLVQTADPGAGSLMLGFTEDPLVLRKWRVVDAQGFITEVALLDLETGLDLDRKLFVYRDPKRLTETRYND